MDIEALESDDYAVWVRFMDAEVLVRHVPAGELLSIRERSLRRAWDISSGGRPAEGIDAAEAARLLGRAAVRGWRGLSMRGEDYPYSPERCDFLMARWAEFGRFVNEAATSLARLAEAQRRDESKNSSLTSGPGSTSRV